MDMFHVIASGGSSMYQSVWSEEDSFVTEKEANEFADRIREERSAADGGKLVIIRGECVREQTWS